MIVVIATVELATGQREAFLNEFHAIVPEVLEENGCIEYGPTVDIASGIDAQPPLRDNVVTIVEKWDSVAALNAHNIAPHMQKYRERVKGMVEKTTLQVLEPA